MSRILEGRVALIKAISDAAKDDLMLQKRASTITSIVESIEKDKSGHLLSTSKEVDCAVSYDPKGGKSETRRTRTMLGRYIRSNICSDSSVLSDVVLQRLVHYVNGRLAPSSEDQFKVVVGQAIVEAYEGFCGANSCMTGSGENTDKVKFYAENPLTVGLLLCRTTEANNGFARALLWTTNEGVKVLDRIYPNEGPHVQAMHDWAIKNGHIYRSYNSLPGCSPIRLSNGSVYTVTMNTASTGLIPYFDTFCWGDCDKKTGIWTLSNALVDQEWDLRAGEGRPRMVQPCFARCEQCNGKILSREHVARYEDRNLCRACADLVSVPCERCNTRTSIEEKDQRVRVRMDRGGEQRTQKWCSHCVEVNTVTCSGCRNIYYTGAALWAVGTGLACDKCAATCPSCGDHTFKSTMVNGLCKPCAVAADADRAWLARQS